MLFKPAYARSYGEARREQMGLQQEETGLSPVRIPEGETYVYCVSCGAEISVVICNGIEVSPLRDEEGNPLCGSCAIAH